MNRDPYPDETVFFIDSEAVEGQIADNKIHRGRVAGSLGDTITVRLDDDSGIDTVIGPTVQVKPGSLHTADDLLDLVFSDRPPHSNIARTALRELLNME